MTHQETDVCLLLEGTYPYVTGGVSSWVHQLVSSLDTFTFTLCVILPNSNYGNEVKYPVPKNVKQIRKIYLHEYDLPKEHNGKSKHDCWTDVDLYHQCPASREKFVSLESMYQHFFNPDTRSFAPANLLDRKEAWQILKTLYSERAHDSSFVDYFWTYRFLHYPIFKILSTDLPPARVYHTVSTGYAGLLAAIGKLRFYRPVLVTEHGIYTRERRIEISRADWIYEKDREQLKIRRSQRRFKDLWNQMFTSLSQTCYQYADEIITLYRGNQLYQLQDGAEHDKLQIIPNGVDVKAFSRIAKEKRSDPDTLVIGLMGRVVSIKDVKTFIRACKGVSDSVLKLKVYIMGPTDEEEAYFQECVKLVDLLGLQDVIEFTGKIDVKQYYPKLDILVLTSISEAQPLVILEASAMGIPVVATDVGACRELLYGRTKEDRELGKSGLIVGITKSDEIAGAILKIWNSKALYREMSEVGRKRVTRFYNKSDVDDRYRQLYKQYREA